MERSFRPTTADILSRRQMDPATNRSTSKRSDLVTGPESANADDGDNPGSDTPLHHSLLKLALEDTPGDETIGWSARVTPPSSLSPLPPTKLSPVPADSTRLSEHIEPSTLDSDALLKAIHTLQKRFDDLQISSKYVQLQMPLAPTGPKDPYPFHEEFIQLSSLSQQLDGIPTRGDNQVESAKSLLLVSIHEQKVILAGDRERWLNACNSIPKDPRLYSVNDGECMHDLSC